MFANFITVYNAFQEQKVENPLLEALHFWNILSGGALRKADSSLIEMDSGELAGIAQKRKQGMPFEYILGRSNFMGVELFCSPATLIPREETELLTWVALQHIEEQKSLECLTIADIGTGCGNIAISLALNSENTRILASDVSAEAVEVARRNAEKFGLQDRVLLFCGDLFSPFREQGYEGKIDIVVCNPPYIPTGSLARLAAEVFHHEPIVALDAGPYGINIFRRLATDSLQMLKPGGVLVFEIGAGQEKLTTRLLESTRGYDHIRHFRDAQEVRVISAVKKR